VPFYSVSGSEFIQMFVGVGASRVRDLFRTAKENSPAIIFIDEIDAVGRQRGAGLAEATDEREQTLNRSSARWTASRRPTSSSCWQPPNRPMFSDRHCCVPAALDRHVSVGRPTQKGRVEIFKSPHPRRASVRGCRLGNPRGRDDWPSPAPTLQHRHEAALWAAATISRFVEMSDFEHARDKILMGPKREEVLSGKGEGKDGLSRSRAYDPRLEASRAHSRP